MFNTQCDNTQKVRVSIGYLTAAGADAHVDGATGIEIVSGDATFERLGDNEFFLISGDAIGDSQFAITADADLGAGVETIQEAITLTVISPKAASFAVNFGVPEPK